MDEESELVSVSVEAASEDVEPSVEAVPSAVVPSAEVEADASVPAVPAGAGVVVRLAAGVTVGAGVDVGAGVEVASAGSGVIVTAWLSAGSSAVKPHPVMRIDAAAMADKSIRFLFFMSIISLTI